MWISQKQKPVNVVIDIKRKFFCFVLKFSDYKHVKHDDASSSSVQTISADIAEVSHFLAAILCSKKWYLFCLFSVFFDTELVCNYFNSCLKSPL